MTSCKSQYRFKEGFAAHLRDKHQMTDDKIVRAMQGEDSQVSSDRFQVMVHCPKCESEWSRRWHLKRHLKTIHKMTEYDIDQEIKKILVKVTNEEDLGNVENQQVFGQDGFEQVEDQEIRDQQQIDQDRVKEVHDEQPLAQHLHDHQKIGDVEDILNGILDRTLELQQRVEDEELEQQIDQDGALEVPQRRGGSDPVYLISVQTGAVLTCIGICRIFIAWLQTNNKIQDWVD